MTQPTEGFGDAEPFVMLGEIRTCNGISVTGGGLVHTRRCPLHGDVATARALLDPVHPGADLAAAEARGYRKAITALRDEPRYLAWQDADRATGNTVSSPNWYHAPRFADYLEAIAEEGK